MEHPIECIRDFSAHNRLTARKIVSTDFGRYKDFIAKLPDPARYTRYLSYMAQADIGEQQEFTMFALRDGDEIVGQTMLAYAPDEALVVFCESEILPAYQGRGLAQQLYDVRLNYLKENGFSGRIETHIKPGNLPSLKAAWRNDFQNSGQMHKGFCVLQRAMP